MSQCTVFRTLTMHAYNDEEYSTYSTGHPMSVQTCRCDRRSDRQIIEADNLCEWRQSQLSALLRDKRGPSVAGGG